MNTMGRRQFLLTGSSGAIALLAGCIGGDEDGSDGTPTDEDDGDNGGTETADNDDADGTETAESDSNVGGGDSRALGETITFPSSYALDITTRSNGQTMEMSGRFHEGDMYLEFQQQGRTMDWYLVGGQTYMVSDGNCFTGMSEGEGVNEEQVNPGTHERTATNNPDLTPTGTETIDGQEVLVYEVSQTGGSNADTVTYYVLADSGYLRRMETGPTTWDIHSWGEGDPVSEPDMNCRSMPSR
ncbi:hypothetical protein SAMN05216388_1006191 [Halorientalis persicus]|jgi:hypothetical protein|uniref:Uncharacterized protein n=1 Tax=Halorientalis persicus TaxID=1367881 RepID=A0A1H8KVR2_9EURY|nr:hypothetical protein [Halorientalis persicus]SEN96498.1 hypothetical protein SAMN05216388_1006191 [Halorientalis persicus]